MSLNPRRVVTFGIAKNGALDTRRITTLGLWPFADSVQAITNIFTVRALMLADRSFNLPLADKNLTLALTDKEKGLQLTKKKLSLKLANKERNLEYGES